MFISVFKDFEKKRKFSIVPPKAPNKPKTRQNDPQSKPDNELQTPKDKTVSKENEQQSVSKSVPITKTQQEDPEEEEEDVDLI